MCTIIGFDEHARNPSIPKVRMNTINPSHADPLEYQGETCPHLGLLNDPETTLAYPSTANVCFHARPVASPSLGHQRLFCQSGQHADCPVFARSLIAPLPPEVRLHERRSSFGRRSFVPVLLGSLVVILAVVATYWVVHSGLLSGGTGVATPTQTSTVTPVATLATPTESQPSQTPTLTNTPATPTLATQTETPTETATPTMTAKPTLPGLFDITITFLPTTAGPGNPVINTLVPIPTIPDATALPTPDPFPPDPPTPLPATQPPVATPSFP
jgi:hypothetical protein